MQGPRSAVTRGRAPGSSSFACFLEILGLVKLTPCHFPEHKRSGRTYPCVDPRPGKLPADAVTSRPPHQLPRAQGRVLTPGPGARVCGVSSQVRSAPQAKPSAPFHTHPPLSASGQVAGSISVCVMRPHRAPPVLPAQRPAGAGWLDVAEGDQEIRVDTPGGTRQASRCPSNGPSRGHSPRPPVSPGLPRPPGCRLVLQSGPPARNENTGAGVRGVCVSAGAAAPQGPLPVSGSLGLGFREEGSGVEIGRASCRGRVSSPV